MIPLTSKDVDGVQRDSLGFQNRINRIPTANSKKESRGSLRIPKMVKWGPRDAYAWVPLSYAGVIYSLGTLRDSKRMAEN